MRLAPAVTAYATALLIGLSLTAWTLPGRAVWPDDFAGEAASGDAAQSIIGQRYLLGESWAWPPLLARRLAAPAGTNVALTDSIPIAMLILKPLRAWLPPGFFVQGAWLALAWVLQPVAAVFALRSFAVRGWPTTAAAAILSMLLPSFIARSGHVALSTHAVILVAIGLYARLTAGNSRWAMGAAAALLLTALLIHPYLLAMAAGVLAAWPLTLLLRRDPRWRRASAWYAGALVGAAGLALAFGYGGAAAPDGYGFYSMDALAPLQPNGDGLLPGMATDATGGQAYEGFQYLGAGLLLLLAAAAVQARQRWWRTEHTGLALVAAGFALFALSNRVTIGGLSVGMLFEPPPLLNQFRATGRFFWPAAYLLLLGALAILSRALPLRSRLPLLAAAVALQVADTTAMRNDISRHWSQAPGWAIDVARLTPIFATHHTLTLWPPFGCGPDIVGNPEFLQTLLLASRTLIQTNTMYTARPTGVGCADVTPALAPLGQDEIRVFIPPLNAGVSQAVPGGGSACRWSAPMLVCATKGLNALDPLPVVQPLSFGEPVLASTLAERVVLMAGWSPPDGVGHWTVGPAAEVDIPVPPHASPRITVTMQATAIAPDAGGQQVVTISAAGQPVATWLMADMLRQDYHADLSMLPGTAAVLRLVIQVAHPTQPSARGLGPDARMLGLHLEALRIDAAP